ncbi:minor tail protein [Stenotrophomonas phage vB_SmaS_Bhz55]
MASFLENIQKVNDSEGGILMLLEVRSPVDPTVLRLVNDNVNRMHQGNEYIAYPFRFRQPADNDNGMQEATLEIDNVGRDMMADIEALGPNEVLKARIIITSRNTPDYEAFRFNLPMTNLSVNMQTITAKCGFKYLASQQAVKRRMSPFYAPGIN